jgi:hypothetical protein
MLASDPASSGAGKDESLARPMSAFPISLPSGHPPGYTGSVDYPETLAHVLSSDIPIYHFPPRLG